MLTDSELLQRFIRDHSQEAFAELVRRHINLAYTAALRYADGERTLAEDATQRVFTTLAREAPKLVEHPTMSGWLYVAARHAAAKLVRSERSRRNREQQAYAMSDSTSTERSPDWAELRSELDQLIEQLGTRERDAVVLRFFEGRRFADIGATLKISEDAVRMRVERALDRLRRALARRGVTSTSAALSAALAQHVSGAAPAGLAASVIHAALVVPTTALSGLPLFLMSMSKANGAMVAGLLLVGVTTIGLQYRWHARQQEELRAEIGQLRGRIEQLGIEAREAGALRRENTELRARDAVRAGHLPAVAADLESAANPRPAAEVESTMKPRDAWRNVGRATPRDAYETVMWACDRGDLDTLTDAFVLSVDQRQQAETVFQRLPEDLRTEYQTPERMMALLFASGTPAAINVQKEIARGPDEVAVLARVETNNGRTNELELPFRRYPDGWKVIVPDWQMNKSLGKLR